MKRLFTGAVLCLLVLSLASLPGLSQDAKTIVEKMIDAQGGRELLEGIKDVTSESTMELTQMGISGSGAMYVKEPNLMRLDMEFMGMMLTQAFDGEMAWSINPQTGGTEELPEELTQVMRNSSFGNSALLWPEKYGITFKLKDKESIDGKEYIVLDRVHSDGYVVSHYIDPETYLIYKTKQQSYDEMMSPIMEETVLTDYKEVEGAKIAHTITLLRDGDEFGVLTVTSVKFNTGLEDSFFKMGG